MNPLHLFWLFASPTRGWQNLLQGQPSIHRLYMLHVIPLSLIPPLMVYFAGSKQGGNLLPLLSESKLLLVGAIFFLVELVVVPVMAVIVRQLAEVSEIKPGYKEAFILAAVAPTPLWLAPLFLLIPSVMLNLAVITLALMAAAGLIYYGIPQVFNLREQGRALLLFGAVLIAGVVAWAFLMVSTLLIWGSVQNLNFVMPPL